MRRLMALQSSGEDLCQREWRGGLCIVGAYTMLTLLSCDLFCAPSYIKLAPYTVISFIVVEKLTILTGNGTAL